MKFNLTVYFNQNRYARLDGYTEGDELVLSRLMHQYGHIEVEADELSAALEELYCMLNRDDRPNGAYERSLSVGDVIGVVNSMDFFPSEEDRRYAVESIGFRRIAW